MTPKQKSLRVAGLSLMLAQFFAAQIMFFSPQLAMAQNTSTPQRGADGFSAQQSVTDLLCTPSDNPQGQDLNICINRIVRFLIVLGVSVGVLMLVWAGYDYMFGGEESVHEAKTILGSVVAGMMIILVSYIFLQQLNPELLKLKTIQPPLFSKTNLPSCTELGQMTNANLDAYCIDGSGQTTTVGGSSHAHGESSCATNKDANCSLTASAGISCDNANDCYVQKTLLTKLAEVQNKIKGDNLSLMVTEAYPPHYKLHKDPCHNTGACVDLGIQAAGSVKGKNAWVKLCNAINSTQGLGYYNELINSNDATVGAACGKLITGGTGDHLHVWYQ